jgi:hypothetical protein
VDRNESLINHHQHRHNKIENNDNNTSHTKGTTTITHITTATILRFILLPQSHFLHERATPTSNNAQQTKR